MSAKKLIGEKIIDINNLYTDDDIRDMSEDYARRCLYDEGFEEKQHK